MHSRRRVPLARTLFFAIRDTSASLTSLEAISTKVVPGPVAELSLEHLDDLLIVGAQQIERDEGRRRIARSIVELHDLGTGGLEECAAFGEQLRRLPVDPKADRSVRDVAHHRARMAMQSRPLRGREIDLLDLDARHVLATPIAAVSSSLRTIVPGALLCCATATPPIPLATNANAMSQIFIATPDGQKSPAPRPASYAPPVLRQRTSVWRIVATICSGVALTFRAASV